MAVAVLDEPPSVPRSVMVLVPAFAVTTPDETKSKILRTNATVVLTRAGTRESDRFTGISCLICIFICIFIVQLKNTPLFRASRCSLFDADVLDREPDQSFKLIFVQCSSCRGVVGVTEYYDIGQRITDLATALRIKLPD